MPELAPIDPRTNPHLTGRFAPVHDEIDVTGLRSEGTIPTDLTGVYMRNGPNPRFTPLGSYTYPMEGDGMIHAVWLEHGHTRYKNRWVRTQGMEAEERAGKAIFGGLMSPAFVDRSLLGPDPDPGWPFRLDPFINIVRHAGRHLALEEGTPPYEVTPSLDTLGRCDFGGRLPLGMCAHPKIDPVTGEMFVFRYDVEDPKLYWAVIGADGAVSRDPVVLPEIEDCHMIHDFAITDQHIVLVVPPVVLDIDAMLSGGDVLRWDPERGTRIAVIARNGDGATTWIETDPWFVWHFANAFDDDGSIVVDFPWWEQFSLPGRSSSPKRGAFVRLTLDPSTGGCARSELDDEMSEFPRIDDRLTGRRHRYVTVSRQSGRRDLVVGEFDRLSRYDVETGGRVDHDSDEIFGEVVFAPRDGSDDELDGYYLTFASSADAGRSSLLVFDAAAFPADPIARIEMPCRVPNGLHGNWIPAS